MANEISLVTYNESLVTPKHDAVIHDMAVENGILYGCKITVKDATTLHMTAGMGIVYGRQFELYESDITVPLAETSVLGRLYVHMDLGNIDEPVQLQVETGSSLSELIDNPNINIENSSTDMELATFTVTTETVGGLKITYRTVERNEKKFGDAENNIKEMKAEISALNVNLTQLLSLKTHTSCNTQGYGIYEVYNGTAGSDGLPSGENRGLCVGFSSTGKDLIYQLFLSYTGHVYYRVWKQGETYGTFREI